MHVPNWDTFLYNYKWSDYVWLLDSYFVRLAAFIPIIGYVILFNDEVAGRVTFEKLTGEENVGFLSVSQRLRFYYYGLILIGGSYALYSIKKPHVMKMGKDSFSFVREAFSFFTLLDYLDIHEIIDSEGHYTPHGKYYTSEWDGFYHVARGPSDPARTSVANSNWLEAKQKYESLLKSLLIDYYSRNIVKRKFWLTICIILSFFGYALVLIPSFDLFIQVLVTTF